LTPLVFFVNFGCMPGREIPLITDQLYHIINRGIASQPIFQDKKDYQRLLETIFYYQNLNIPLRYSFFLRLTSDQKNELLNRLKNERNFLVEIIAYCLMPNHFHFLLKQSKENGISVFVGNVSNSYTRYFNTKYKRTGPLLQGKFKAVRVESDEQLLHLTRYIHLNPFSSCLVKTLDELYKYHYSSISEYLSPEKYNNCQKDLVLDNFKKYSYKTFLSNQADYQRRLQEIKFLTLEKENYPRCAI